MSNAQSLRLCCETGSDGNQRLVAMEGSRGTFFPLPSSIQQMPVEELFLQDVMLVNDWMAFVVKSNHDFCQPSHDKKADCLIIKYFVYYMSCSKKWALIKFAYDAITQKALVEFEQPPKSLAVPLPRLQEHKQKLWLKTQVHSGGEWEVDLAKKEIFLSQKIAQLMGQADRAVVLPLEAFYQLIHPEDIQELKKTMSSRPQERMIFYHRVRGAQGQMVHFKSAALLRGDHQGNPTQIMGYSQNITEKEEAQAKLALSEQRFRGIVENAQDLLITINLSSRVTYVSPNIATIAGYRSEDVLGQDFSLLFADAAEEKRAMAHLSEVLSGQLCTMGEYRVQTKQNDMMWLSMKASPILGKEGQVQEILAICQDVTEKKRQEKELNYMSSHDALTGAWNRAHFEKELKRIDQEEVGEYGLILTDVNGLKLINDALGHEKGDWMLKKTFEILTDLGERVYRVGGDEFAILLYGCTNERLDRYCDRIFAACKKTNGTTLPLSISLGAALSNETGYGAQALYRQVEGRMYNNKLLESRSMHSQVISSLKEALKARNLETSDHTQRMERMVVALGKKLELSNSDFDKLVLLASMHDIGKVAIPDAIINKPSTLDEGEWQVMRTHSEVGGRIAQTSSELSVIAQEICCHHENWDGSGYPYGYRQEQIPLLARIISVVDTYDAMTNGRVYRSPVSHTAALEELRRCSGTQFDPKIVNLFSDIFGKLDRQEMSGHLSAQQGTSPDLHRTM